MHRVSRCASVRRLSAPTVVALWAAAFATPRPAIAQFPEWERVDVPSSTTFLSDVWACSLGERELRAFAVGHDKAAKTGVIYQYDGTSWTLVQSTTFPEQYFNSVWGLSATDVIAVGENVIYRYNGTNWAQAAVYGSYDLRAVWASGPNDIFAVGYQGLVLHYTGPKADPWTEWLPMNSGTSATLNGVWGSGPNDVWAVAGQNKKFHYDGTQWTEYDDGMLHFPETRALLDIHGTAADDIFVVGEGGLMAHYNGTDWQAITCPAKSNVYLRGVWAHDRNLAYAAAYDGDIYSIGLSHGDWIAAPGSTDANAGMNAVAGDDYAYFAVGFKGEMLQFADFSHGGNWWQRVSLTTTEDYHGIWGNGTGDLFAVGNDGLITHSNGATWSIMNSNDDRPFHAVWGSSSSNVFATVYLPSEYPPDERGEVHRYDGVHWDNSSGTSAYHARSDIWGSGPDDIFVVSHGGDIIHYDGKSWSQMDSGTDGDLLSVWGSGPTDVFAVGAESEPNSNTGLVLHYDGLVWAKFLFNGPVGPLRCVWGSGPNDIFALGLADDQMWHFNGSTWSNMPPPSGMGVGGFTDVWGSSASDVFAVGDYGLICHYDGKVWTLMDSGTDLNLNGVWGSGADNVYAVGDHGIILHYPIPQPPPPSGWALPACCSAGSALPIVSTAFLMRLIPTGRRRPRAPGDD